MDEICMGKTDFIVIEKEKLVQISTPCYAVEIDKKGFKYAFKQPDQSIIAEAHNVSGIRFAKEPAHKLYDVLACELRSYDCKKVHFRVVNSEQDEADVNLYIHSNCIQFEISPVNTAHTYIIDARTGPVNPAYGLGDYGSHADDINKVGCDNRIAARDTANVFGLARDDMTNIGSCKRFVSNFVVFPSRGFAQVLFEEGRKRFAVTAEENSLGAAHVRKVDKLYYFFGGMEQIYGTYREIRHQEGYEDAKPHYEMFCLGWEAYGALGWNAYQKSVEESICGYLDRGYDLKWAVIGSGFWKGDRKKPDQGVTTNFGMWDDSYVEERTDGLPNPRFPDVKGMKEFFRQKNIKLMLGLRNSFKAEGKEGGFHNALNDGNYMQEALDKGYFLKNESGSVLKVVKAEFPKGTIYLLDGSNGQALEWYLRGADLWGVDGFKEDAMIYQETYHDGNWNPVNIKLSESGKEYLLIVRNTAYSVPGDLMRINDSYYGHGEDYHHDPDRMPINLLNFAASGAANTYPDIVGGTPKEDISNAGFQKYVVRNAMFSAVCPSVSVGRRIWDMNNPEYEKIVKKALDWHNTYAPYIYSAAVESYRTGYPHTMTPLHIAYPKDVNTYHLINRKTRQYEWMLGPSMMAAPLFGCDFDTAESRDVYLPEGKWMDYETGEIFYGPVTLKQFSLPMDKMPVFIGGKGIVVYQSGAEHKLHAEIYPVSKKGSSYCYTWKDGITTGFITNDIDDEQWGNAVLTDISEGVNVPVEYNRQTNSYKFEIMPGHNYRLSYNQ